MIIVGRLSGIFIPMIKRPIAATPRPPTILSMFMFTKLSSLGPTPAAKTTIMVAIMPANRAANILCFIVPSNKTAVNIAPGPAMNSTAIENAFSGLKNPARAAKLIGPVRPPIPSSVASLLICFDFM